MSNKKGSLGKGLGALFGETNNSIIEENILEENTSSKGDEKQEIDIAKIVPNPYQPRKTFDEEKLKELAESIKAYGIVEPLVVRKQGRNYELVAGERRLRAAQLVGLKTVPVILKAYDDIQLMTIALIENIQRHDLNAIEEAQGISRLMQECHLTQEQVAEKVGRSRSAVANILRLLNLPEEIQYYIANNDLTMGQAKSLAAIPSEEKQCEIARLAITNDWNSRIVEEVVRKIKEGKELEVICEVIEKKNKPQAPKKQAPLENDVFYKDYENKLVELLGTKVKVQPKITAKGIKGGTIQIDYYSEEDLERIYEVLQPKKEASISNQIKKLNV